MNQSTLNQIFFSHRPQGCDRMEEIETNGKKTFRATLTKEEHRECETICGGQKEMKVAVTKWVADAIRGKTVIDTMTPFTDGEELRMAMYEMDIEQTIEFARLQFTVLPTVMEREQYVREIIISSVKKLKNDVKRKDLLAEIDRLMENVRQIRENLDENSGAKMTLVLSDSVNALIGKRLALL